MKGHFLKKVIIFSLITMMLFSITSCGNSSEGDKDTEKSSSGDSEKPEKITLFADTILKAEEGQDELAAKYQELTGIELEIIQPEHNTYYEKMSVTFASGDVPDVVEISEQNYVKYASQGALADITELVENSEVFASVEESYLDAIKVNGKLHGTPLQNGGGVITMLRKDWLDKLGLEVPTTYDEYIDVLKAFKTEDPDENGKDDTIPLTAVLTAEDKLQTMYLTDFLWGSNPDFTLVDGEWIDGFAQDNYKEALERMAAAYEEGLIDGEIFTNETSSCRDKFTASQVGAFSYWNNYWISRLEDLTKQQSDENAELVSIPSIEESNYLNRAPLVTAITTKCENIEGVFTNLLEYMHNGEDGQVLFSYGVEDTHWQKTDDGAEMLPQLNNPEQLVDKVWFSSDNTITEYSDGPIVEIDSRIQSGIDAFKESYEQLYIFPASDTYTQNYGSLDKKRAELAAKVIKGDMSSDEAMAEYAKQAESLKVDKILEEFNANTGE
jgi:putative aldouronate transport system substrate-binding protein